MPFGWQSDFDMATLNEEDAKHLKSVGFNIRVFGKVDMASLPYQSGLP